MPEFRPAWEVVLILHWLHSIRLGRLTRQQFWCPSSSPHTHTLRGHTRHFQLPSDIFEDHIPDITPSSFFPEIFVRGDLSGLFLWTVEALLSRIRFQSLRLQECHGLFNLTVLLGSIGPLKRSQLDDGSVS